MKFQGFIGPAYTLDSVNVDAQRCVNLYPEINEMGKGKEGELASLHSTPGLDLITTVGTGPIRLVHADVVPASPDNPTTRVFVVSGNELYKLEYILSAWVSTSLGILSSSTGVVSAASSGIDLGQCVFVDGTTTYLYKKYDDSGIVETFGTFASFSLDQVNNATHVVYVDSYFIVIDGTNKFYVSNVNELVFDPLSFASAEGNPDNAVAIITNRRDLWIFGDKSIELWIDTGNVDFPFDRASGGFIEKGCAAKHSVAKIDNMVFWIGKDEAGQGIVYAGQGLNPSRISTHAIETALHSYADISSATAYTYQSRGHAFYVLNFTEATWVYDLTTQLWHERAFTTEGSLGRQLCENHAFIPELGIHMLGDYSAGYIYKYNDQTYTDSGYQITRLRASPHVSSDLKYIFFSSAQFDVQTGVGLDGETQGTDPLMMLDWSDDGGHTWSQELTASMGKIGETKARVKFNRLGRSRDRIFRVKITDPVKVVLISAQLDLQQGTS